MDFGWGLIIILGRDGIEVVEVGVIGIVGVEVGCDILIVGLGVGGIFLFL